MKKNKDYYEKVSSSKISKRVRKKARDYKQDARLKEEFWRDRANKNYKAFINTAKEFITTEELWKLTLAKIVKKYGNKNSEGYSMIIPREFKEAYDLKIKMTDEDIIIKMFQEKEQDNAEV